MLLSDNWAEQYAKILVQGGAVIIPSMTALLNREEIEHKSSHMSSIKRSLYVKQEDGC